MCSMKKKVVALGILALLIGGIGLLIAADDANSEAVRKERRLYQGIWRVTAVEADGSSMSEDDCAQVTVFNEVDGKWTVKLGGAVIWKGISSIDPIKTPKTIDFIPTEGADFGKTFFGIYEIGGETRRLCYSEAGKTRPTEFSAKSGSGHVLVTFKRERSFAFLPGPH
jgi:uncharacterized protein (TIGR03067 family)